MPAPAPTMQLLAPSVHEEEPRARSFSAGAPIIRVMPVMRVAACLKVSCSPNVGIWRLPVKCLGKAGELLRYHSSPGSENYRTAG